MRRERRAALEAHFECDLSDAKGSPAAAGVDPSSDARTLTLRLPLPWSTNELLRARYDLRNRRRELLKSRIKKTISDLSWVPLTHFRVDIVLNVTELRDEVELGANVKIEMDALQETNVIASDGPRAIRGGSLTQRRARPLGVTITLTEMDAAAPKEPFTIVSEGA